MKKSLQNTAVAALAANPGVLTRIEAAGPKNQYKAVGRALAQAIAKKVDCTVHQATWALVNAAASAEADGEEINDF